MARTTLTVNQISLAGVTPSYGAADNVNGMQFANNGEVWLHIKCTGAGACTVTLTTPLQIGGVDMVDPTVTVPITTGDKIIGPFSPQVFNQAGGVVYVDFSTGTGVTVAAFKLS